MQKAFVNLKVLYLQTFVLLEHLMVFIYNVFIVHYSKHHFFSVFCYTERNFFVVIVSCLLKTNMILLLKHENKKFRHRKKKVLYNFKMAKALKID